MSKKILKSLAELSNELGKRGFLKEADEVDRITERVANHPGIPPYIWDDLKDCIESGMSDEEILDKVDTTPENVAEMREILKEKRG